MESAALRPQSKDQRDRVRRVRRIGPSCRASRSRGAAQANAIMSMPLAVVDKVSHRFGAVDVLKYVNLEIQQGSFTVLLGPSGSGKTTLLLIIGGFLTPSEGRVFIAGQDCTLTPPAQRLTTTVFQDYALFPH